ncbi:hypothetical protein IAR55_003316 [Kwoniella newhampshirensis]|uniref:Uncharacterized protein n=1 Tax=Kwoniella newhampshirensis TaxID=1651941 RepID=A0AAW0YZ38_9TREE
MVSHFSLCLRQSDRVLKPELSDRVIMVSVYRNHTDREPEKRIYLPSDTRESRSFISEDGRFSFAFTYVNDASFRAENMMSVESRELETDGGMWGFPFSQRNTDGAVTQDYYYALYVRGESIPRSAAPAWG